MGVKKKKKKSARPYNPVLLVNGEHASKDIYCFQVDKDLVQALDTRMEDLHREVRRRNLKTPFDPSTAFVCKLCCLIMKTQKYFNNHIEWHRQKILDLDKAVTCPICQQQVEKKWDLNMHIYTEHRGEDVICPVCMDSFKMKSLWHHFNHHFSAYTAKSCKICGKTVKWSMNRHLCLKHGIGEVEPKKIVVCQHCGKNLHSNRVAHHMKNHHQNNVWKCRICEKEFNNMQTAKNHTYTHSITKPWKCYLCDYCSYSRNNVVLHLSKTHKEEGDLFKKVIKTCEYLYEFEFKGGLLEKFVKPEGATYTGNKKVAPASYRK